jgi:hypothetical protein
MVATYGYVGPMSSAILWSCMGVYGFGLGTIIAACMTMLAESGVQMTGSRAAGQTVFGLCGDGSRAIHAGGMVNSRSERRPLRDYCTGVCATDGSRGQGAWLRLALER